MAEPIAGPRRPRPTKTRRSRVWRSVSDVMQNRSNRGSGKPAIATAPRARAYDWDPTPRIALGPAAMYAAPKGRTHGSTRPACINVTKSLANREPSTHGSTRPACINVTKSLANREPSTHGSTRPACINVTKSLANREPSTHGSTRPACINVTKSLANREPSTHVGSRPFVGAWRMRGRCQRATREMSRSMLKS